MAARRGFRAFAVATAAAAALASCTQSPGLQVHSLQQAASQGSRVRYVVLHYTATGRERSLAMLSQGPVSSHYLITDQATPRIYRLVDETRSAWHAGDSQWYGHTWLNSASIGIEIVNAGWSTGPDGTLSWEPYTEAQMQSLILLLRDIVERHGIEPQNIVGHSDISPGRKHDPGPLFPWKRLALAGLGRWYDETAAAARRARFERTGVPDAAWFQQALSRAGYAVPRHGVWDDSTRAALRAFQMHYRPACYDGEPDAETAAILLSLDCQQSCAGP